MRKKYLYAAGMLLAVFSLRLAGQQIPPNLKRKLTASDFRGAPDPNSNHLATTFTHLTYQYSNAVACPEKGKLKFSFQTTMHIGAKSWMKFDKIKSRQLLQELLDHEQGHYDIAEIFSEHLQKSLNAVCFNRSRYEFEIDSAYRSLSKYYDTIQVSYDVETNNGQDKDNQARWKNKIEAMSRNMPLP